MALVGKTKFRVGVADALQTMAFEWVGYADDVPGAVASAWMAARIYCPGSDEHGPFSFTVRAEDVASDV